MKLASLITLVIFIVSCGPIPEPPEPPPTPEPPPDKPPNNGRVCEINEICDCWHKPPGEDWQYLGDCEVEPPEPPEPPKPPTECGFPQQVPDDQFVRLNHTNRFRDVINPIMSRMTGCPVGTNCPLDVGPDEWMESVIQELCAQGLNAGRHRNNSDQISVSDKEWCSAPHTNQQIYEFGGGKVRWKSTGNNFNDWDISSSDYCSGVEPPNPIPPGECGDPIPPDLSHFRGPKEKDCNPWCDATPYVCDTGYCREIGFTDGRGCCAVRTEGTPDRQACEAYVVGGKPLWRSSHNNARVKSDNPFRAQCGGNCAWLEACHANGTRCNRKTFIN